MGNKTTTKKTTTSKRAAAKAAAPVAPAAETGVPETLTKPKRVTKPAAKKPATPKRSRKPAVATSVTAEDIALRAYFIAQNRQRSGEHGTPEGDWLEAERQLASEDGAARRISRPSKV